MAELLSTKTFSFKESFKWKAETPTGDKISKRYQHSGAVVGSEVFFIGGQELPDRRFNEIYALHTETMEVRKITPKDGVPPKFARHSSVTIDGKIHLFGGFDGIEQHYHLSVYDPVYNTWTNPTVKGNCPPSRTNHSATTIGNKMYIFGGMYKDSSSHLVFLNDLYVLDTSDYTWTKLPQLGDAPAPRCGHRMASLGGLLILFGGGCGEQWDRKYSDLYVFDPATNTWLKPKIANSAPVCTFTVAFTAGPFFFVFGGQSLEDNNLTNDLYSFDAVSMEWSKIKAGNTYPGARDMASGNVLGSNMYMFGGYCGAAIDTFYTLQMPIQSTEEHGVSMFPIS